MECGWFIDKVDLNGCRVTRTGEFHNDDSVQRYCTPHQQNLTTGRKTVSVTIAVMPQLNYWRRVLSVGNGDLVIGFPSPVTILIVGQVAEFSASRLGTL
jgi:hypothetical protein